MQDKLPHYTTLQKFSARSQVLAIADAMIRTIGRAAGAAAVCEEFGGDGCDGDGDDDGQRAFSKPERADTAQMGESVDDCVVREFAAVESGVGLGAGQRQEPGQGVDGQGQ